MSENSSKLPEGWSTAAVEDIAQTATGGTPSRKREQYYGGTIPWVKSGDLNDGLITGTSESITDQGLHDSNAKVFPRGAVCVALYGATVGKLGILDIDAATNQAVCGIFPEGGIESKFVFYSLRNERENLISQAQGGAQPNISNGIVKKTVLRVPPLAEQRRIVAKIEALQERSAKARDAVAEVGPLLQQFRQSLLAAAFRGDLTADWRADHPGLEPASELLNRIRRERRRNWEKADFAKHEAKGKRPPKDWQDKYKEPEPVDESNLPVLPDGWCWEPLEALVPAEYPVVYGIILPGPHVPDGVPYVRPTDIMNGAIHYDQLPRTSPEIAAKYERASLKGGDLVFSVVGTIGKSLIVDEHLSGANITQSSVRIRMLSPFTALMILRALQSQPLRRQMDLLQFGNAVQRLNVEHMRRLAIPVPPIEEWNFLSELIESSLDSVRAIEVLLAKSESDVTELDQSILSKAFRGELVPQDPNDEPASVLLERIREARNSSALVRRQTSTPRNAKVTKDA